MKKWHKKIKISCFETARLKNPVIHTLLFRVNVVQECDATAADVSTGAGKQKKEIIQI